MTFGPMSWSAVLISVLVVWKGLDDLEYRWMPTAVYCVRMAPCSLKATSLNQKHGVGVPACCK